MTTISTDVTAVLTDISKARAKADAKANKPINQFAVDMTNRIKQGLYGLTLELNAEGLPKNTQTNLVKILRDQKPIAGVSLESIPGIEGGLQIHACSGWVGVLRWNDLQQDIEKVARPPWGHYQAPQGEDMWLGSWTDADDTRCAAWLYDNHQIKASDIECRKVVAIVAQQNRYNPVTEYLESLEWDGLPRLDKWLTLCTGAKANNYHQLVGRFTLVGAVARAFDPGCKLDTVLVLEGAQGRRKDTLFDILASGPKGKVYAETPLEWGSKDRFMALRGKWIYNLSEMTGMARADQETLKGFLSAKSDTYRPSYGRSTIDAPRRCAFVATVNPAQGRGYLKDPTGARRYWPVEIVGDINIQWLKDNRDQLWAEAVHAYRFPQYPFEYEGRGRWWPVESESAPFLEAQGLRSRSGDLWVSELARLVGLAVEDDIKKNIAQDKPVDRLLTPINPQWAVEKIGILLKDQKVEDSARIGRCLTEIGFRAEKKPRHFPGIGTKSCWVRPNEAKRRMLLGMALKALTKPDALPPDLAELADPAEYTDTITAAQREAWQEVRAFAHSARFPNRDVEDQVCDAINSLPEIEDIYQILNAQ